MISNLLLLNPQKAHYRDPHIFHRYLSIKILVVESKRISRSQLLASNISFDAFDDVLLPGEVVLNFIGFPRDLRGDLDVKNLFEAFEVDHTYLALVHECEKSLKNALAQRYQRNYTPRELCNSQHPIPIGVKPPKY